jgi:hypothetical protein
MLHNMELKRCGIGADYLLTLLDKGINLDKRW